MGEGTPPLLWVPYPLWQAAGWHPLLPRDAAAQAVVSHHLFETLIVESEVLCSRLAREAEHIFEAIEKEGLEREDRDKGRGVRPRQIHDPGIQQEPPTIGVFNPG